MFLEILKAILMGIVEGITEWLSVFQETWVLLPAKRHRRSAHIQIGFAFQYIIF